MRCFSWMFPLILLTLAAMACSLTTAPISGAQNLASTAEALATSLPSDLSVIPGMPDITGFLNPSGAPVEAWNGIPIMPEAIAGEEFDLNTYSFRTPGITGVEVEEFYDGQLEALGWSSPARTNVGTAGGYMLFSKGTSTLNILINKSEGDIVVLLIMP